MDWFKIAELEVADRRAHVLVEVAAIPRERRWLFRSALVLNVKRRKVSHRNALAVCDGTRGSTAAGSGAAVEILVSVWPADVANALRAIVRDESATDDQRVERIISHIQERGLKPQPPEEIPDIRTDDVRLVCYQLVLPKGK